MSTPEEDTSPAPRPSLSDELDDAFSKIDSQGEELKPSTAFLVGLSGKHAGKLFRIEPGDSLVGRSSKCFLKLDEKAVSHLHARLTLGATGCIIRDLESTNGSFLNDQPITAPKQLHAGDVLKFGNSVMGFLTDAEDEEQHTRALARITQPTIGGGRGFVSPMPNHTSPDPGARGLVHAPAMQMAVDQTVDPDAYEEESEGGNPLDDILDKIELALGFLKQYWKLILGTSIVCSGIGAATIIVKPPVSQAQFEIFLRAAKTTSAAQHFATRGVNYFTSAEKNFSNEDLVRKTLKDMNLPAPSGVVFANSRGLAFKKEGTSVYHGSYSNPSPEFAEKFLAHHLQNYLEWEISKAIKVLHSEVDLLRTQYEKNSALLKEHEDSLRSFKEKHMAALPEVASGQFRARDGLLARRDSLSASLTRSSQQLALTKRQLASEDAFVGTRVQRSQPYETGLTQVRQKIAKARAQGFTDEHPDLVKFKGEEEALLRLRDQTINTTTTETDRRANPEHKRLQNRLGELQVAVAATGQELGQINTRLAEISKVAGAMPQVEAEVAEKIREVDASKKLHEKLYEQLKAKELELQFERASVAARYEILEPPRAFPLDPVKSTMKRAGAGAAGGIVLGIIFSAFHWLKVYARNRRESTPSITNQLTE